MPRSMASRRIEFSRRKYGPELLVDVGWIHDFPTFIVTAELTSSNSSTS